MWVPSRAWLLTKVCGVPMSNRATRPSCAAVGPLLHPHRRGKGTVVHRHYILYTTSNETKSLLGGHGRVLVRVMGSGHNRKDTQLLGSTAASLSSHVHTLVAAPNIRQGQGYIRNSYEYILLYDRGRPDFKHTAIVSYVTCPVDKELSTPYDTKGPWTVRRQNIPLMHLTRPFAVLFFEPKPCFILHKIWRAIHAIYYDIQPKGGSIAGVDSNRGLSPFIGVDETPGHPPLRGALPPQRTGWGACSFSWSRWKRLRKQIHVPPGCRCKHCSVVCSPLQQHRRRQAGPHDWALLHQHHGRNRIGFVNGFHRFEEK